MIRTISQKYKEIWSPQFALSAMYGIALYVLSIVVNFYATMYTDLRESSAVSDIVLSNIRSYDTDGIIIYTALVLAFFSVYLTFIEPRRIPFAFKAVATFVFVRAAFITLTHLGPFYPSITIDAGHDPLFLFGLTNTGDLFFSGHTGMPFLAALMFWEYKPIRYIYLGGSILLGVCVLLAHLHYSIDVASAYFITYGIFQADKRLFSGDWATFTGKQAQGKMLI